MNVSESANVKHLSGNLRCGNPSPQWLYTNGHHTDGANLKKSPNNLPITITKTSAITNAANKQLGHVGMTSPS